MENLFDFFAADLLMTIIVFLVMIAGFAYLFAGKKFTAILSGLIFSVLSLFTSPFVYLKRTMLELVDYSSKGKVDLAETKHYLLNRLVTLLQALLVVLSAMVFAVGLVSAWGQLFPSKALRETIGATEEKLKKLRTEIQETEPAVSQMETVWSSRKDSLVRAYNAERPRTAGIKLAQNNDLAGSSLAISDSGQLILADIKNYHAQNEFMNEPSQFESVYTEIINYIDKQNPSPEMKNLVSSYNDNWYAQMLSRFEPAALSESQLRFVAYPAYHNRQLRLSILKETIPAKERDLEQFRAEEKFNIEAFGLQIVITILVFMVLVWLMGLLIESFRLSVDVAADLHNIREHFSKQ